MSAPGPLTQQVTFRAFRPSEWPPMSKHVRKDHERMRNRGFNPEEIRIFKSRGNWKAGAYVEGKTQ